jgi:hypothetical protein
MNAMKEPTLEFESDLRSAGCRMIEFGPYTFSEGRIMSLYQYFDYGSKAYQAAASYDIRTFVSADAIASGTVLLLRLGKGDWESGAFAFGNKIFPTELDMLSPDPMVFVDWNDSETVLPCVAAVAFSGGEAVYAARISVSLRSEDRLFYKEKADDEMPLSDVTPETDVLSRIEASHLLSKDAIDGAKLSLMI